MRGMLTKGSDFETSNLRGLKEAGYPTAMSRLQKNAVFDKEAAREHEIPGTNVSISGFGRDTNGNSGVYVNTPNQRRRFIQTGGNMPKTYNAGRDGMEFFDTASPDAIAAVEQEVLSYIQQYGSGKLKEHMQVYDKTAGKKTAGEDTADEDESALAERDEDAEFQEEENQEPTDGDYTMTPSGNLGSKISVGVVDGKFLGEFADEAAAEKAIKADMEKNKYWPGVWWVSDHGNVEPYSITAAKKTAATPEYIEEMRKQLKAQGLTDEDVEEIIKDSISDYKNMFRMSKKTAAPYEPIKKNVGDRVKMDISGMSPDAFDDYDTLIKHNGQVGTITEVVNEHENVISVKFDDGYTVEGIGGGRFEPVYDSKSAAKKTAAPSSGMDYETAVAKRTEYILQNIDKFEREYSGAYETVAQAVREDDQFATLLDIMPEKFTEFFKKTTEELYSEVDKYFDSQYKKKKAAIYDGYGHRVTIEAKAGDYNESYTPITSMLAQADIRYREVKRYTIDPDRMLLDILITKEDVPVIQELNDMSKETGITFTFNENISESIKAKQVVSEDSELGKDKPVTAAKKQAMVAPYDNPAWSEVETGTYVNQNTNALIEEQADGTWDVYEPSGELLSENHTKEEAMEVADMALEVGSANN